MPDPVPDLSRSGASVLLPMGQSPLRVVKREADKLLWAIYGSYCSASEMVERRRWKKPRNEREAATLARILDLRLQEAEELEGPGMGIARLCNSAPVEVLLRRFHALLLADVEDSWRVAEKLEELPPLNGSSLPPSMIKTLLQQVDLDTKHAKSAAGKGSSGDQA